MYTTKGTDIMESMLLSEYSQSPNLKQYLGAYVGEMDILFSQIEEVYLGRLLDYAIGKQLDIIGVILGQSRNIPIPNEYFGFQGAVGANGFGEKLDQTVGGIFKSEESSSFTVEPLNDAFYRKVLRARGFAVVKDVWSVDDVYAVIDIVIGTKVEKRIIETQDGVELTLDSKAVTNKELSILLAIRHWYSPLGLIFNISLV